MGIIEELKIIKEGKGFERHRSVHFILLMLIVITLPYSTKLNSFLIILLFLNSIISQTYNKSPISIFQKKNITLILISLPFIFNLLSITYTENLDRGFFSLEKNLSFLVMPIIFVLTDKISKYQLRQIFIAFIISISIAAFICLVYSIYKIITTQSLIDNTVVRDRDYYYFVYSELTEPVPLSPIYFGMYLNFAIFLLMYLISIKKRMVWIWLFAFLSIFNLLVLSKINILLYFLIIIICVIRELILKKKLKMIIWAFTVIGISAVIVFLVKPIKERLVNINYFEYDVEEDHMGNWNSANLRLAIWDSTLDVIKENPLIGVGAGDDKNAILESYKKNNFKMGLITEYNPHNLFLSLTVKYGLIASLIIFIANFLKPFIVGYRYNNILAMLIIIFFINSLIEVTFATQKGVVFYTIFICLLLKTSFKNNYDFKDFRNNSLLQ